MNQAQQLKPDPKGKAIASFWLGIVSIVLPLSFWLLNWLWTAAAQGRIPEWRWGLEGGMVIVKRMLHTFWTSEDSL